MIGTDENRAVLHVEVIFWGGKRKSPPSLVSGKYSPHFVVTGTTEYSESTKKSLKCISRFRAIRSLSALQKKKILKLLY